MGKQHRSRSSGGFAAAQCGEALPNRRQVSKFLRVEAQPRRNKSKSNTVSQRLTAVGRGRAAMLVFLLLTAFCLLPSVLSQNQPTNQPQPTPSPSPAPSPSPSPT